MKIVKQIEQEGQIDWMSVFNNVKADVDKWVQSNIDDNANPFNQSFDYDIVEYVGGHFGDNVVFYLKDYGVNDNIPDFIWDELVKEFEKFITDNNLG